MAEWIVRSHVDPAARDRISLLPTVASQPSIRYLHDGCLEGGPAVHTLIQCTPLLVEKAGVEPDVTLSFIAHKQVSLQVREPPWL